MRHAGSHGIKKSVEMLINMIQNNQNIFISINNQTKPIAKIS
jgi:hypothetical protein